MERDRTARILKRFFCLNVFKDVSDYCHSYHECQKEARKTGQRAPMIPLPIMGQPFERIAIDIVGPLPRSIKGYKYILVVCDYATRYPKAIPLKKFTSDAVAEELISLFARYGVPKEILTERHQFYTTTTTGTEQTIGSKANQGNTIPSTNGRTCGTVQQDIKRSVEKDHTRRRTRVGKISTLCFICLS